MDGDIREVCHCQQQIEALQFEFFAKVYISHFLGLKVPVLNLIQSLILPIFFQHLVPI